MVYAAAEAGFRNLSCDLMLALPEQTADELEQTISRLVQLPITHVSAYLLKVEQGTPFAVQHVAECCPDDDTAADLYLQAVEQLGAAGFLQYEISNFAKAGFESRHNCKYWHCEPYLGIGPSAHSCWNGKRFLCRLPCRIFWNSRCNRSKPKTKRPAPQRKSCCWACG